MRELSKSMLSFSWALSLLAMKQAINLLTPSSGSQGAANVLDPITQTVVGQLDESMKGIFRSGDNVQSKAVDMMAGMLNPGNWMGACRRTTSNGFTAPKSSDSPAPAPITATPVSAGSPAGWAPMPEDSTGS
jgi:hypothetical protein